MKKMIAMMMLAATSLGLSAQNKAGIDPTNLDKTVNPTEDFYQFATGGWQKKHPLPAAYSRYGSFDMLSDNTNKRINTILGDLQKKTYKKGTTEQKLSDLYKLALDVDRRNSEGIQPVKPLLDEIAAAKTKQDLENIQLKYPVFKYGIAMGYGFGADNKNSTQNILRVSQGGLTLGQKDYYLNNDEATVKIREAYREHIVKMFQHFGFSETEAQQKRDAIFRYETMLALLSKSRTELRDPEANYNKMTLADFKKNYPNIPLEKYVNAQGIDSKYCQEMIVGQPAFLAGLDKLNQAQTVEDMRAYMEWDVIHGAANYLSDEIRLENFDFFGKTMSGRKEEHPLWKRATSQVQGAMGEALGKMYCERYFPASSKKKMEELVRQLQISLNERIDAQEWMAPETKAAAHEKLNKYYVKIGYPNKWKDYSDLQIDASKSFYENMKNVRIFANKQYIKEKVGKPVDRDEWHMTPQTVNAYYNATTNEICFPAAILQYPFFDPDADEAFNYGAIGVVIGHEMTHGFDDKGRKYASDGNLKDWWTAEDAKGFEQRANMYADFFDKIKVLPDLNANGRMTLGENLADHGGLEVAFNAFKNVTANKKSKTLEGFTPEQRFFIAYATLWGQNITEKEIRNRVKTDVHSLGKWRVNGALPHINAWYDAFNVKPGDKMYLPEDQRLKLW